MNNVLIVANFDAGRRKAVKYRKKLQKLLLKNCDSFKFVMIDDLASVDFNLFDTVIAMGGDGTVNKLLQYVIEFNLTLGIVPCGTANLLAAKLGIPSNINKSISILERGKSETIDVMDVNGKLSVLRFGVGYDSDIICKTPQSLKNKFGYFAYFIAGILFALRLKKKKYLLNYEDDNIEVNSSCIIVANSPNMYKNIVSIGKNSSLNDGLFEVFVLKTSNPIFFFFEFLAILLNIRHNSPLALYFKTNTLEIKNNFMHSHIDGEKCIFKTDLKVQLLSNKIKVIKA